MANMIKVIATKTGHYQRIRQPGEIFDIPADMLPAEGKKPTWFEKHTAKVPELTEEQQDAIAEKAAEKAAKKAADKDANKKV